EEYTNDFLAGPAPAMKRWPAELLVWRQPTAQGLVDAVDRCHQALVQGASPPFADLACSLGKVNRPGPSQPTLAVVAVSLEDLKEKLGTALEALRARKDRLSNPRGIWYAEKPADGAGKVAFLFPGQGSQYP